MTESLDKFVDRADASLAAAKGREARDRFERYSAKARDVASPLEIEVIVHRVHGLRKDVSYGPEWDTVQLVLGILADVRAVDPVATLRTAQAARD
jgi:hypothetical protein